LLFKDQDLKPSCFIANEFTSDTNHKKKPDSNWTCSKLKKEGREEEKGGLGRRKENKMKTEFPFSA